MKGIEINYLDHPSPEDRQKHIFEMFDTEVPDDFDTTQGNEILNIFLDSMDKLKSMVNQ